MPPALCAILILAALEGRAQSVSTVDTAKIRAASFAGNRSQPAVSLSAAVPANPLPANFLTKDAAAQHLPFFCGQELKMDKRLPVPLRLRLGSLQQTDWLERKPGAVDPR